MNKRVQTSSTNGTSKRKSKWVFFFFFPSYTHLNMFLEVLSLIMNGFVLYVLIVGMVKLFVRSCLFTFYLRSLRCRCFGTVSTFCSTESSTGKFVISGFLWNMTRCIFSFVFWSNLLQTSEQKGGP